ncbi:hypothetical protein [Nocardia carnea]|uniref:Uncharacterized protein n=1 Tax=Nocardia carnea TaxID=37328 RepID=A0ABW7TGR1_9NOCA|nr:hypothetical protein [Nocardia carnea]
MSRISSLNQRYDASAALFRNGVQILTVGDPGGARFNLAVQRLMVALRDDGPGVWDDLVGASKAMRWRLITQPQPLEFNPGLIHLAEEVRRYAQRLSGAVDDQDLLNELDASAAGVVERNSTVGNALLRDCVEAGPGTCVVVAASKSAQIGLERWLQEHDLLVLTPGELERDQPERDQAYVVGPPKFFRSSLVTAPLTNDVSFLFPAWFKDHSVPCSALAPYAEGAIRIKAKPFTEGDTAEPEYNVPTEVTDEDVLLPHPVWGNRRSEDREPTSEEVVAHKVLLSGNLAMWLDDGERIRSLDPEQPAGERVTYTEVAAVRGGTHLLLRQGVTERGVLYHAAIAELGHRGGSVEATQALWKDLLARRIRSLGHRQVVKELQASGVKSADRARAWTDPNLIRPSSDRDFDRLLQWLGIPVQPSFGHANWLRKMLYQASSRIGKQLEVAVSAADLSALKTIGHLSLDVEAEGFRGILATRVLAISPYPEIVSRHDARVLFEDRSGQWLE